MHDIIITNCRIMDGAGSPWYWGDIGVNGEEIVAIGRLGGDAAQRVIDADGRVVTPGFIDMHTHSDLQLLADPLHECKTRQGVTTDVLGHDGLGLAPITADTATVLQEQLAGWNGRPAVDWNWTTISTYLDRFDGQVAVNVAMLAPHGTIRMGIMGMEDRDATPDEMRKMQAVIDQCMREGAIGLSTGLTYAPCSFASDEELVALCRMLRPYFGFYCPHHRNYGTEALQAYADSIEIARRAGIAIHLTHCHLGFPVNRGRSHELIEIIDSARADGVEVTLDTYPYLPGSTYLHALLPTWMNAGGNQTILARLQSADILARLRHELEVTGSDGFQGVPLGWEMIQISGIIGEDDSPLVGLYLPEAAKLRGKSPLQFFVDLLLETRLGVSCLAHIGNEENVRSILQHPAHTVGSDGILVGGRPHPRGWGSHVKFLCHYVRDLGLLTWEEGVRHITSAPARRIGALDRGILRPGFKADLVVFDPSSLGITATYENPRRYPTGVDYVFVNGISVVEDGVHTGATPGKALRTPYGRQSEHLANWHSR